MKDKTNIYDFIKSNGFEFFNKGTSDFFGDFYDIFSNNVFQLRFSSSRSIESVDLRKHHRNESWYDLPLIKALMLNERELNYIMTIEEQYDFLQKELLNISKVFDNDRYPTSKQKLKELGKKRAEQLFVESCKTDHIAPAK